MIDLETLERRQQERIEYMHKLAAFIERERQRIEHLKSAPPEPTTPTLALVK